MMRRTNVYAFCLCVVLLFGVSNFLLSNIGRDSNNAKLTYSFICIVGNAPGIEEARRVYSTWQEQFPTFFYLWGKEAAAAAQHGPLQRIGKHKLYVQSEPRGLPFTNGIEAALESLQSLYDCDYIFTHDDDLVFTLNESRTSSGSLVAELEGVLRDYHPALASFHYAKAKHAPNQAAVLSKLFSEDDRVRAHPLVTFDNGMVIYHKSVVDFFIPFSPRGEGNITSGFTLNYFFIALFATTVFREHSLAFANIYYNNTFTVTGEQYSVQPDGLVLHIGPRHLYEWKKNKRYVEFLTTGLKCPFCRWGRDILVSDIDWVVARASLTPDYGSLEFLQKMNQVFFLDHPSLANNELLRRRYPAPAIADIIAKTPLKFRILIFTYRRLHSFERLWRSIVNAHRIHSPVEVTIFHDFDDAESAESQATLSALLGKHNCPHGPVRVVAFSANRSLKRMIMDAWWPTDFDEYAIFLEDDIDVSPYFLRFAESKVRRYFYCSPDRLRWKAHLLGISLYAAPWNEVTETPWIPPPPTERDYFWQMPISWGSVIAPTLWLEFKHWWQAHERLMDPVIADSYANRWPSAFSWKKYLLRWMVASGRVMLFPNFPAGQSLSMNCVDLGGTNDRFKSEQTPQLLALRRKYFVPLLRNDSNVKQLFALHQCQEPNYLSSSTPVIFDAWGVRRHSFKVLETPIAATSFDNCTIVMAICHRVETVLERLAHYGNLPKQLVSAFVLLWQPCVANLSIPSITRVASGATVTILQMPRNSMNNRFYPHAAIATDCVISIDDDIDVPLAMLEYAIRVWRGHFWNNLVGFSSLSRNHWLKEDGTTYRYSPEAWRPFASMVLPAAMVYHRKYLHYYSFTLAPVFRAIVDNLTNCDDILFNFMVANLTNEGPAVVNASVRPVGSVDANGGLWHRTSHMAERSWCVTKFAELFGRMPLRYTTTFFQRTKQYGTFPGVPPGKHHFAHQERSPVHDAGISSGVV